MIIVRVELLSAVTGKTTSLGCMHICNDGTGSETSGHYDVRTISNKGYLGRSGRVERYPHKAVAIWNLVRRACEAAGYTK